MSSKGKIFSLKSKTLPSRIPDSWKIIEQNSDETTIEALNELDLKTDVNYSLSVQAASSLPDGFEPSILYKSNFHPRGLQLAIIGASDSIKSVGIDWEEIKQLVAPDQIAVYSASAMAQLDSNGTSEVKREKSEFKAASAWTQHNAR